MLTHPGMGGMTSLSLCSINLSSPWQPTYPLTIHPPYSIYPSIIFRISIYALICQSIHPSILPSTHLFFLPHLLTIFPFLSSFFPCSPLSWVPLSPFPVLALPISSRLPNVLDVIVFQSLDIFFPLYSFSEWSSMADAYKSLYLWSDCSPEIQIMPSIAYSTSTFGCCI